MDTTLTLAGQHNDYILDGRQPPGNGGIELLGHDVRLILEQNFSYPALLLSPGRCCDVVRGWSCFEVLSLTVYSNRDDPKCMLINPNTL